jgi:hypothetical protein
VRRRQQDRAGWELAAGPGFSPRDVPEVAAGYWWEAGLTSGFGTTAFRVIEGNGHSTFDLIQGTVANQPTVLTENGGTQFRHRKIGDNPTSMATAAGVLAGWTGATYIGMWLRLPVDLTGTNNLFLHQSVGAGRMGLITLNGTPDIFRINLIDAAQAFTNTTFSTPFADLGWHWIEAVFDPLLVLGGTTSADFAKAFRDLVALAPVVAGSHPAAIANVAGSVRMTSTSGGTANNPDVSDWAACYYANGIPSLQNRVRLANHRNPTGVLLA